VIGRKAEIGVKQDARSDLEAVDLLAVRKLLRLGDRRRQPRDQLIGAQQIVVFEQRVVDITGDDVLGGSVGHRGIERLGRLVERGIEHLPAEVAVRIGAVGAA
jgi:hypothetical protein